MNLADCRRRMEAAAADGSTLKEAMAIAAEVRRAGLDFEADLLLVIYGEQLKVAADEMLAEVAR